jgi:hypothetical protein
MTKIYQLAELHNNEHEAAPNPTKDYYNRCARFDQLDSRVFEREHSGGRRISR